MLKMARPRINIDKKFFESLCALQCTLQEIASAFECSEDTIERWCERTYKRRFADVYGEKRGRGKISLRRSQFKLAEKSAAMAIWLGKQYLDQRETHEDAAAISEDMKEDNEILRGMFGNA